MQPQLACAVHSDTFGTIGYVVIHNRIQGRACGGVRLVQDICLEEMQCAAKTMAYKSGFIGFPMGGAKAAVRLDSAHEPYKDDILREFGSAIAPLLKTGAYLPGLDMHSTVEDIQQIFHGAGMAKDLSGWRRRTPEYTAWSCFISTLVALEAQGIAPGDATFAVQGFGKVAAAYVRLMARAGATLLGVSNLRHALVNRRGFDSEDLLRRWHENPEDCLAQYAHGEYVAHEHVLTAPVTILLPAARAWAVHADNSQDIQAPIIVCAANVAMDDEIERQLGETGKIVVPDFVANCGGLLGSVLDHEVDTAVIWKILDTSYRQKIAQLIARSATTGQPISTLAGREAEERITSWSERDRSWLDRGRLWLRGKAPERLRTTRHVNFYTALWASG